MLARVLAVLLALTALQDTGVLRIRVVLSDSAGAPTPIPRVLLLVSDNPATNEPRRVRTANDGTVELKLRPGSYTIESDQPIAFGGVAYSWTQTINVVPGRDSVLDLIATNAETGAVSAASGAIEADSAAVLSKWQDTVVEIWTPTRHVSGFVIDSRGLIATSYRALGNATDVEIEIATGSERVKVAGTVVHSDRLTGAAIVWIDPRVIASTTPIELACAADAPHASAKYRDQITAIGAPMFTGKELIDGEVRMVTPQATFIEMRLSKEAAGGPAFTSDGEFLGITSIAESQETARRPVAEQFIVPATNVCETLAAAEKKLTAPPPPAAHLPLEPSRSNIRIADVKAPTATPRPQPPRLSASDFDIMLLTSSMAREVSTTSARLDLANWADYVRDAPEMLMIRVSPQFEESVWKTIARGAAATQGMALPPLKSFTSNFLKMRAYCGDTEVTPIHPFIIEREVSEKDSLREGLYVYRFDALGPQCPTIRLSMYSEKQPNDADTKTIDPKLFEQLK